MNIVYTFFIAVIQYDLIVFLKVNILFTGVILLLLHFYFMEVIVEHVFS